MKYLNNNSFGYLDEWLISTEIFFIYYKDNEIKIFAVCFRIFSIGKIIHRFINIRNRCVYCLYVISKKYYLNLSFSPIFIYKVINYFYFISIIYISIYISIIWIKILKYFYLNFIFNGFIRKYFFKNFISFFYFSINIWMYVSIQMKRCVFISNVFVFDTDMNIFAYNT